MIHRRSLFVTGAALLGTVALTGCLSDSESSGDFAFERVALSTADPEEYETCDDVPDQPGYGIGEQFWVLVALGNIPTDGEGTASLTFTVRTEPPDGQIWEPVADRQAQWETVEDSETAVIWETLRTFEENPAGEYEMTVTVNGTQFRTTEPVQLDRGGE